MNPAGPEPITITFRRSSTACESSHSRERPPIPEGQVVAWVDVEAGGQVVACVDVKIVQSRLDATRTRTMSVGCPAPGLIR